MSGEVESVQVRDGFDGGIVGREFLSAFDVSSGSRAPKQRSSAQFTAVGLGAGLLGVAAIILA